MKFKNGIELDSATIESAIKDKYGFDAVTCIENVLFCAERIDGNLIEYSVYEMVYLDSSKEPPTNYEMIISQLNKSNNYEGVQSNDDGYVIIDNHLFMFSQDNRGKI